VAFPLNTPGPALQGVARTARLLGRDYLQDRADGGGDAAFIGNMIFPLTLDEAKTRWVAYVGDPPEWFDDHHELYGCRHWDGSSRKCTAYEQRPVMCRAYPYLGTCEYCGYQEPNAWWSWDPKERAFRETAAARAEHGTDWQMPAGWPYTWDGEWLRPVTAGG
jgi:Fe-S-cluster containining protein